MIAAPARLAIDRMTSAPAAVSPVATTVQAGRVFQAGTADGSEHANSATGRLGGLHHRGLLWWQVGRQGVMETVRLDGELDGGLRTLSGRIVKRAEGTGEDTVPRGAFGIEPALTFVGGKGADVDQAHDVVGSGGDVGDHRTTVGVSDGEYWAGNRCESLRSRRNRWRCPEVDLAGAVTRTPAACSRSTTPFPPDASANTPWSSTTGQWQRRRGQTRSLLCGDGRYPCGRGPLRPPVFPPAWGWAAERR